MHDCKSILYEKVCDISPVCPDSVYPNISLYSLTYTNTYIQNDWFCIYTYKYVDRMKRCATCPRCGQDLSAASPWWESQLCFSCLWCSLSFAIRYEIKLDLLVWVFKYLYFRWRNGPSVLQKGDVCRTPMGGVGAPRICFRGVHSSLLFVTGMS